MQNAEVSIPHTFVHELMLTIVGEGSTGVNCIAGYVRANQHVGINKHELMLASVCVLIISFSNVWASVANVNYWFWLPSTLNN